MRSMKKRSGALVGLAILLVSGVSVGAFFRSEREDPFPATPSTLAVDREILLSFLRAHPSKQVQRVVHLIEGGQLRVVTKYVDPVSGGEIRPRDILYIPEERMIIANDFFLRSRIIADCVRMAAIQHQAQHIVDHDDGMKVVPLHVPRLDEHRLHEVVRWVLHAEWRAVLAEQELRGQFDCPALEYWELSGDELCTYFKWEVLTGTRHVPPLVFQRFPQIETWVQRLDCTSLSAPF